jgi:hypothetical protein
MEALLIFAGLYAFTIICLCLFLKAGKKVEPRVGE